MGKPVSIGQSHTLMAILAGNVDWSALDAEGLQRIIENPKGVGRRFTTFLQNEARITPPYWINVDRITPFNLNEFFREKGNWQIEETDARSVEMTRIDLSQVVLKNYLASREGGVSGEQRESRMKRQGDIRLDAKVFEILWRNQRLIPEQWKQQEDGNYVRIFFNGTVFRSLKGTRTCFHLQWQSGKWFFGYEHWLSDTFRTNDVSAVLESPF